MGAFQIVYDDFSGGQYMGNKATNLPKNSWKGNNVVCNPNGELIPTGTKTVATYSDAFGNFSQIYDHWNVASTGYVFVNNTPLTPTYKMIAYSHTNGTSFPVTPTAYTLTMPASSSMARNIAYSSVTDRFYYGTSTLTPTTTIYRVSRTGTDNTSMTGTIPVLANGVVAYNLRLLAWGNNNTRLYYTASWSGTDFGAWSSTQYYEFDSKIRMVFPRTEDLLVVCEYGIYSLTGVLGASVNIQMLSPGANFIDGMQNGDVVNRSLYHLDVSISGGTLSTQAGNIDGRLYQFIGATARQVATFEIGDYPFSSNGFSIREPGRVTALPGGRIAVSFQNGYTYFEISPGLFARSKVHNVTVENAFDKFKLAKTGPGTLNEYILTAVIPSGGATLNLYRTLTNVAEPTYLDANFSTSTSSTCTDEPTGTAELSEYWHQKPFTVKEMFVEYSAGTAGSVSAYIQPTGVVDVAASELPNVVSQTIQETAPPAGDYRMYRYWPNNASKGFGVKPILTINNCSVKRVILNCED